MKRNYRKVLLSLCIIAMSLSLIVGATFAIFESENKIKIPVSSGVIDITATTTITQAWSAEWDVNLGEYVDRDVTLLEGAADFTCGGKVFYDAKEQAVNLKNIAPGDGVELKVELTNASTIKAKYNVNVARTSGNAALVKALKIEIDDSKLTGEEVESGWRTADIPADGSETLGYATVKISLPMTEGIDNLQDMSCELAITVNAVQFNAHIEIPEVETGDVTLDSNLIDKVNNAIASADIESAPAIVFGTWGDYQDAVIVADDYSDYEDGLNIPGEINARIFRIENKTRSFRAVELEEGAGIGMDALYVLAGNSITAAENGEESFTFADSEYIYVDMSGVDFSNTTSLGNMFKNSQIQTLIMQGADLSNVTDLESMFSGCTALAKVDFTKANLSSLKDNHSIVGDVEISAIHYLFEDCESLAEVNFSGVDLSGITNLFYAFASLNSGSPNTTLMKADFSGADIQNVTTMGRMFGACAALKEVTFEKATMNSVEDISQMFANCKELESVNFSWVEIPNVTTKLAGVFGNCEKLDKVNFSHTDLSGFTTFSTVFGGADARGKNVDLSYATLTGFTTGQNLFQYNKVLESVDLSHADLSNATTMLWAFSNCTALKTVKFEGAKLGSVTTMEQMFTASSIESFVGVFKDCDLSKLKIMKQMFDGCKVLTTVDFSDMDLSDITDMSTMFRNCTELATVKFPENKDLSSVTDMGYMFQSTKIKSVDLTGAKLGKLSTVTQMFNGAPLEKAIFTHADLSSITDLSYMFQFCSTIKEVDFSYANLSGYVTMDSRSFASKNSLISANFSHAIFTNLTSLQYMFNHCTSLEHVYFSDAIFSDPKSGLNSKVTTMYGMFNDCPALKSVDLSGVDLSKVTTMSSIFAGCAELAEVDFSNTEFSSGLTSISVFYASATLQTPKLKTVDFSGATLTGVKALGSLFKNCTELQSVDFSDAQFGTITGVSNIFSGCKNLKSVNFSGIDFSGCSSSVNNNPLGQFDAAKTTLVYVNFSDCNIPNLSSSALNSRFSAFTALEEVNLSGAKMPTATQANGMFSGCTSLTTVYLWQNDNLLNLTNTGSMFYNCSNLEHIYVEAEINLADSTTLSTSTNMFNGCANLPNWNSKVDKTNAHTNEGGYFTVKED